MRGFIGPLAKKSAIESCFDLASRTLLGAVVGGVSGALLGGLDSFRGTGSVTDGIIGGAMAGSVIGMMNIHTKERSRPLLKACLGVVTTVAIMELARNDLGNSCYAAGAGAMTSQLLPCALTL